MAFRQALACERELLFSEGYKEWPKNRTYEQYCADNAKEDATGTRFVLELGGELVSSLILLTLKDIAGKKAFGIGSVLTPKIHGGKGNATALLSHCIRQEVPEDSYLFLFSDINPDFYTRFNFRALPSEFQRYEKSTCMVYCTVGNWDELLRYLPESLPNYF
jgi:hypothetical protein